MNGELICSGCGAHSHGLRGPTGGEGLAFRHVVGEDGSGSVQSVNTEAEGSIDFPLALTIDVDVPGMVHQIIWNGEGGFEAGHLVSSSRIRGAVVNNGAPQTGDVLVFKGDIPNHHFIDHALEIRATCTIDAQFVKVNVGE